MARTISIKKVKEKIINESSDKNEFSGEEIIDVFKNIHSHFKDTDKDELKVMINRYLHYSKEDSHYFFETKKVCKKNHYDKIEKRYLKESEDINSRMEVDEDEPTDCDKMEVDEDEKKMYTFPTEEYTVTKRTDDENGPYGTQWIHDEQVDDDYDEETLKREKQFEKLRNIVLPDQRSPEWFEMRSGRITASDGGCVLGVNKYEPSYKFITKKIDPPPFKTNKFCYHGTKLEEIATMIYEYRMNVKVEEFGMMGHHSIPFLGASPDGIIGKYKLDMKSKTKYVGRMLEIKCPFSRTIKTSGEIYDNICPAYYWIQVQQQLECCDLDECDFWQCNISEYKNRKEFVEDTDPREPFRSKKTGFEKGCLIQLLPKSEIERSKRSLYEYEDVVFNHSKFLYPPKIEMTPYECDHWVASTFSNFNNAEYKDGVYVVDNKNKVSFNPSDYVVDKVLYWRLENSHCVTIHRDREWFERSLPTYDKMWKYVTFFRKNADKKKIFLDYIETRDKKINDDIMKVCEMIYNTDDENYDENIKDIIKKSDIKKSEYVKKAKISSNRDYDFI